MYKTIKMWNYFDIFGESFLWLSIKIVKKQLSLMKNNWNHKYETIPPIPCKFANSFQVQLEENEQISQYLPESTGDLMKIQQALKQ